MIALEVLFVIALAKLDVYKPELLGHQQIQRSNPSDRTLPSNCWLDEEGETTCYIADESGKVLE